MYELYEEMIAAVKTGDREKYMPAARKWFQACKENPFKEGVPAHEAFFQTSFHYSQWIAGGINSRVSKIRYSNALESLAKMKATNPYSRVEPVKPQKKNANEVTHMLGILPEKPEEIQIKTTSEAKEELKEDTINEEKKGLFGWFRKRTEHDS